mmetsp:Transcript_20259/g.23470  ORF Transcript_20259/g.23470 Transcript_20259/m.23470 type:complete len:149 (-) Transcript_20259:100-546(-)
MLDNLFLEYSSMEQSLFDQRESYHDAIAAISNSTKLLDQEKSLLAGDEGERVEADDGYSAGDPEFVKTRSGILHPQSGADVRNKVRARQETVNQRLKMFQILCKPFRHSLNKHGNVFNAVALIVQISIEQGEPLFQIEKYDDSLYKNR